MYDIYTYNNPLTWITFIDAAPALPTFIVTGLTRADLAKFCIFLGIVAENNNVCLCPCCVKIIALKYVARKCIKTVNKTIFTYTKAHLL